MFTGTHFRLAGEWSSAGQRTGPVFMCRAFQEFFLQSNCCLTRILFQVEIKEGCGCKVRRISEYESPVTANLSIGGFVSGIAEDSRLLVRYAVSAGKEFSEFLTIVVAPKRCELHT
jgi:hypothetical protein